MALAGIRSDLERMIDVSTSGLLLKLKDKRIISRQQYNLIKAKETEDIKVTTLLDMLEGARDEKLPPFYEALEETDQGHVKKILKRNAETKRTRESTKPGKETSPGVAEPKSRKRRASRDSAESSSHQTSTGHTVSPQTFISAFAGKQSELEERLNVSTSGLLVILKDNQIIDERQCELIEAKETEHNKVKELLKELRRTDDDMFPLFKEALKEAKQLHAIKILERKGGQ